MGDSSGGTLSGVLTSILIEKKIFKPAGVVMVYPALNLNYKSYTPSLLSSLNDLILPHTYLKICLSCYLQDENLKPESDPLISPLFIKDSTLQRFPKTKIFVGDIDAFHDDALRFTERLKYHLSYIVLHNQDMVDLQFMKNFLMDLSCSI